MQVLGEMQASGIVNNLLYEPLGVRHRLSGNVEGDGLDPVYGVWSNSIEYCVAASALQEVHKYNT